MTNPSQTTLVLGGTGRTGSLVAKNLRNRGLAAQTAARHGADVLFDWDDPATQSAALTGADRIYLVAPVPRVRYAGPVSAFLDLAEGAGVRHVTYGLAAKLGRFVGADLLRLWYGSGGGG